MRPFNRQREEVLSKLMKKKNFYENFCKRGGENSTGSEILLHEVHSESFLDT